MLAKAASAIHLAAMARPITIPVRSRVTAEERGVRLCRWTLKR